jgi:ATP-dependent Lon protease
LKDLDELPAYVRRDIDFQVVDHVDEVLKAALVDDGKVLRLRSTEARMPRRAQPRTSRSALK